MATGGTIRLRFHFHDPVPESSRPRGAPRGASRAPQAHSYVRHPAAAVTRTKSPLRTLFTSEYRNVLLVNLLIGSLPGVIAGSLLSSRSPDHVLRPVLAIVLLISGYKLLA